jgi:ribonuclease BN (tRNA processing enzyme)
MNITILPSGSNNQFEWQYATSYLINDTVAIDAGCIGLYGSPDDQSRIENVFLTHSHADHIGTLPIFLENTFRTEGEDILIHGHADTVQALQQDIFNDRIWPDYFRFSSREKPRLRLNVLEQEKTVTAGGLKITPVTVNHVISTFGYIVEDSRSVVVFGADSGPTARIWDIARRNDQLKTAFIEVTFPNEMEALAVKLGHLTAGLFAAEIVKLPPEVSVIATHIKPRYHQTIIAELEALQLPHVVIGIPGKQYSL